MSVGSGLWLRLGVHESDSSVGNAITCHLFIVRVFSFDVCESVHMFINGLGPFHLDHMLCATCRQLYSRLSIMNSLTSESIIFFCNLDNGTWVSSSFEYRAQEFIRSDCQCFAFVAL